MEDVISLSIGEPDFFTPWHIREEGITTLEKGRTRYTPEPRPDGAARGDLPLF